MEDMDKQIHHYEQQHQHYELHQQQQFMTMKKQQIDLIVNLLKNQPPVPIAPIHSPIQTTSASTEIQALLKAIGKDKLSSTLIVPTFTHSNRNNWCSVVKSKLKVCPRYRFLHDDINSTLTDALATVHP